MAEQKIFDPKDLVLPPRPDMPNVSAAVIRKYSSTIREKYCARFEPKKEDILAALKSWDNLKYSIQHNPLKLASDVPVDSYSKILYTTMRMLVMKYQYFPPDNIDSDNEKNNDNDDDDDSDSDSYVTTQESAMEERDGIFAKVRKLIDKGVKNKEKTLHPYLMYCASKDFYYGPPFELCAQRRELCKEIYKDLKQFLAKIKQTQQPLEKKEKEYAKWLLTWSWKGIAIDGKDYFTSLKIKAIELMDILSKPLIEEYLKLQQKNSPLIGIKLMDKYRCDEKIQNNNDLLSFMWQKWFKHEKKDLTDEELDVVVNDYKQWGFCDNGTKDEVRTHLLSLRLTTHSLATQVLPSSVVIMDMINQVAVKINPKFQAIVKDLYEINIKQCEWLNVKIIIVVTVYFLGQLKQKQDSRLKLNMIINMKNNQDKDVYWILFDVLLFVWMMLK